MGTHVKSPISKVDEDNRRDFRCAAKRRPQARDARMGYSTGIGGTRAPSRARRDEMAGSRSSCGRRASRAGGGRRNLAKHRGRGCAIWSTTIAARDRARYAISRLCASRRFAVPRGRHSANRGARRGAGGLCHTLAVPARVPCDCHPSARLRRRRRPWPGPSTRSMRARIADDVTLLTQSGTHWLTVRGLLADGHIAGAQVHDARVAALCRQHGVRERRSADRDFSRFSGLALV